MPNMPIRNQFLRVKNSPLRIRKIFYRIKRKIIERQENKNQNRDRRTISELDQGIQR